MNQATGERCKKALSILRSRRSAPPNHIFGDSRCAFVDPVFKRPTCLGQYGESMNEEEVKVKFVLPWLESAGVEVQDLQFERTFSVRVGLHDIKVPRASTTASGRLDILVRQGNRNLLIVETKREGSKLDEGDRD